MDPAGIAWRGRMPETDRVSEAGDVGFGKRASKPTMEGNQSAAGAFGLLRRLGGAAVDDGRHFRSGRELAAWIGLVPRQYTTGGKPRLGGIGRRANHYLRRQMIHGARSVVMRLAKHDDRRSEWLKGLSARRGFNRTIVALANKTARIAWVMLTRKEVYTAA